MHTFSLIHNRVMAPDFTPEFRFRSTSWEQIDRIHLNTFIHIEKSRFRLQRSSWLLLVMFIVFLLLFTRGVLGHVLYLIVSFPDLCRLSYLFESYCP